MSRERLHPAARGFDASVDAYERGRPGYPPAAVERIVERLGLRPGRTVLDLAAGTGKLTRLLVPSGANVIAVEPLPEMRRRLAQIVPSAAAMAGTAERLPLVARSVDAVTVGSAFHWFRTDEALHEIHRVLRPGGGLALAWNARVERDPYQAAISEIIGPLQGDAPRRHQHDWHALLDESALFGPCEASLFKNRQNLDEEGLVGRVLSVSFVASAPRAARAEVEERVRALAREAGGTVRLPYVTEIYVAFAAEVS